MMSTGDSGGPDHPGQPAAGGLRQRQDREERQLISIRELKLFFLFVFILENYESVTSRKTL